jgi:hypothetical protein
VDTKGKGAPCTFGRATKEREHEKSDFQSDNLHWGLAKAIELMVFVIYGFTIAAGIGCAFVRHPVLVLIAVCPLLAAGALLGGIHFGTPAWLVAGEVFGSIAAPQITFMAVSLTHFAFKRHLARTSKLIPQVQKAIGQQLRDELGVPRTLSPDLARLVSQLSFA